jgi:hypothetical protein
MMLSIEKDQQSIYEILLHNLGESNALTCINLLVSKFILDLNNKYNIPKDSLDYLHSLDSKYNFEKNVNLIKFVSIYKNIVRSDTNGALYLSKIFISNKKYKQFCEYYDMQYVSKCKILQCDIETTDFLKTDNDFIAICNSKFDFADCKSLIIKGTLE